MLRYKLLYATVICHLLFATDIIAQELPTGIFRNEIRALGMGNAFIASGKLGGVGFLYNPALLNRNKFNLSIPSIRFEFNPDIFDAFSDDLAGLGAVGSDSTGNELDVALDALTPIDNLWNSFALFPKVNLAFPNFGLALYGNLNQRVLLDKGIYLPQAQIESLYDIVATIGVSKGIEFRDKQLAVGVNLKGIARLSTGGAIRINAGKVTQQDKFLEEVADTVKANSGGGFGLDLGFLYPLGENSDIGLVLQDVVGKIGGLDSSATDTEDLDLNVKLGYSRWFPGQRVLIVADLVDLFNTRGDSFFNKIRLGAELDWWVLRLRTGINAGYPSFGGGLNFWVLQIDIAFYTRELGDFPGHLPDKNFAFEVKLGW